MKGLIEFYCPAWAEFMKSDLEVSHLIPIRVMIGGEYQPEIPELNYFMEDWGE